MEIAPIIVSKAEVVSFKRNERHRATRRYENVKSFAHL
jgi:hypothetical protein